MTVTIFMVSLCGAMFVGMPVAFALLVCAVSLMVYLISVGTLDSFNTQIMAQYLISGADNFPLMAIPFFMLAGEIMTRGGISQQIVKIANALVGHIRGGLGYVAIMAGLVLAAISGSAAADTAALAAVVIPLMRDAKYNVPRSAGLIAGAGCIAPILPPAMPLVLFGVVSQLSITKLFFTGIFPGLLMALSLVITWRFVARKDFADAPKQKFRIAPLLKALREGFWALTLPVIILGGMKSGAFTPTEAAVVAAVIALLISLFIYKGLKIRDLPHILLTAAKTCSAIMLIVAASMVVAWLITIAEIPGQVTAMMQPFMHNKTLLMARADAAGVRRRDPARPRSHGADPDPGADAAGQGGRDRPVLLRHHVHDEQRHRPHHAAGGHGAQRRFRGREGQPRLGDQGHVAVPARRDGWSCSCWCSSRHW